MNGFETSVFDHLHFRTLMKEVFGDKKKGIEESGGQNPGEATRQTRLTKADGHYREKEQLVRSVLCGRLATRSRSEIVFKVRRSPKREFCSPLRRR